MAAVVRQPAVFVIIRVVVAAEVARTMVSTIPTTLIPISAAGVVTVVVRTPMVELLPLVVRAVKVSAVRIIPVWMRMEYQQVRMGITRVVVVAASILTVIILGTLMQATAGMALS